MEIYLKLKFREKQEKIERGARRDGTKEKRSSKKRKN
jgi:hypothetical protein